MRALVLATVALVVGWPAAAAELTVSVAVSVKEPVEEVGRRLAAARPGLSVRYNVGASGELQKQIEAGAPVDVFVSAGVRQMDDLQRRGLIVAGSRRDFAVNALVVVKPADSPLALARAEDLLDGRVRRIAIGNPRTVPAGQYAEESLRKAGLWERLQPRLVVAENVRQVLDWVARGEVDAGWVYATDLALRAGRVKEAFRPPADSHRPIVYPAAVVAASPRRELGEAFVALLAGPDGRAALARHGFGAPTESRK